jgi:hypothetical protein
MLTRSVTDGDDKDEDAETEKEVNVTVERISKVLEDDDDDKTEVGRMKKRTTIMTLIRNILNGSRF